VNELEVIRAQLGREAAHVSEVCRIMVHQADQGVAAGDELLEACAAYLEFALHRLDPTPCAAGLQKLAAARAGSGSEAAQLWRGFLQCFESEWRQRQARIETATKLDGSIAAWRAAAPIDADSILQERDRYARVAALRHPAAICGAQSNDGRLDDGCDEPRRA